MHGRCSRDAGGLEEHQKDLSFSSDESPKKDRRMVRRQGVFVPEGLTLSTLIGDVPINSKDTTLTVLIHNIVLWS
jgi:hypothetical protein